MALSHLIEPVQPAHYGGGGGPRETHTIKEKVKGYGGGVGVDFINGGWQIASKRLRNYSIRKYVRSISDI